MSINRVNISGNLTRDPELRATQGGITILRFGVAVNDRRKNNQTGEWEDKPNYVDCKMFGRRAESLGRYLHKGMKVAIDGKLDFSQWQDRQTGQNRSRLEVIVDEIEFMSSREGQGSYRQASNQDRQPSPRPSYQNQMPAPIPQVPAAIKPVQQVNAVPFEADPVYNEDITF